MGRTSLKVGRPKGFPVSVETKEKLRIANLGKKYTQETCNKIRELKTKTWEKCGYMARHKRIWKKYGKAIKCNNIDCKRVCIYYEWANLSGEYKENKSDWMQMCCSCHKLYDLKIAQERQYEQKIN